MQDYASLIFSLPEDVRNEFKKAVTDYCKKKINKVRYQNFISNQGFEIEHFSVDRTTIQKQVFLSAYAVIVAYMYLDGKYLPITKLFFESAEKSKISISSSWVHFSSRDTHFVAEY